MMRKIVNILSNKNEKVSFAESITGGALASKLIRVSGASKVISSSYIVYSNDAKIEVLGIEKNLIDTYGVVSKEVAYKMAENLAKISKSELNVSTTGYAEGDYDLVCFVGISYKNDIKTYKIDLNQSKSRIKNINYVVEEIIKILKETLA